MCSSKQISRTPVRWLYIQRMFSDRLLKIILYGELTEGKRPVVRSKLRYKDVIKRDMKDGIDPLHYQTVAEDRSTWRVGLNGGSAIDIKAYLSNHAGDQVCEMSCW